MKTRGGISTALLLTAGVVLGGCGARSKPGALAIAAAADLQFALEEGAAAFHLEHPEIDVKVTYGSSGNFYQQIRNGAPFEIFLSADAQYPRNLAKDGLAPGGVFNYADGRIVVWVPAASKLDPATALRDSSVQHISIANPAHAPYGRAAEAALHSMGIYEAVQPKLVVAENISQAFQFAQSGAAEVGIVALSLASAPAARDQGRFWEVPPDAYPKIEQAGAILKDSPAAHQFRDWLTGAPGHTLLLKYGFSLPGN